MVSPRVIRISLVCVFAATSRFAEAQQAVDGTQNQAAIEQSRLYRDANSKPAASAQDDLSSAGAVEASASDDDSFGAQRILKMQERPRAFVVSGSTSLVYSSNVALTRRDAIGDFFAVGDAAISWSPQISPTLLPSIGLHASIFRYDKTTALDFANLGFGAGLVWAPRSLRGASVVMGYDFSDLLNDDGREILRDHSFNLGLQKAIALGRAHGLAFGVNATLDISDPSISERQQLGGTVAYHLALSRKLDADLAYHPAVHFYSSTDRVDFNQILTLDLRYRLREWIDASALFSYGFNRSNHSPFDYEVLTSGATIGANIRF